MSDSLKQALQQMQKVRAADNTHNLPITYLHDPETYQQFAVLVDSAYFEQLVQQADPSIKEKGLGTLPHSHCEGDEDQFWKDEGIT